MELQIISPKYGKFIVTFDDIDSEMVSSHRWFVAKHDHIFYAVTHIGPRKTRKMKTMHRLIMGLPGVDHKDGNGLNNFRDNLRFATIAQNDRNRKGYKNNLSGFKGVGYLKSLRSPKKYRAQIFADGKRIYGGVYETAIEAARVYNEMAIKHHGEFARLNII